MQSGEGSWFTVAPFLRVALGCVLCMEDGKLSNQKHRVQLFPKHITGTRTHSRTNKVY